MRWTWSHVAMPEAFVATCQSTRVGVLYLHSSNTLFQRRMRWMMKDWLRWWGPCEAIWSIDYNIVHHWEVMYNGFRMLRLRFNMQINGWSPYSRRKFNFNSSKWCDATRQPRVMQWTSLSLGTRYIYISHATKSDAMWQPRVIQWTSLSLGTRYIYIPMPLNLMQCDILVSCSEQA